jgi:hypothetical protein
LQHTITITNNNFYTIRLLNATSKLTDRTNALEPKIIGLGLNTTQPVVGARARAQEVLMNNTATVDGWVL